MIVFSTRTALFFPAPFTVKLKQAYVDIHNLSFLVLVGSLKEVSSCFGNAFFTSNLGYHKIVVVYTNLIFYDYRPCLTIIRLYSMYLGIDQVVLREKMDGRERLVFRCVCGDVWVNNYNRTGRPNDSRALGGADRSRASLARKRGCE